MNAIRPETRAEINSETSVRATYHARKAALRIIRASDDLRKAAIYVRDPVHQQRLRQIADGWEQLAESCRPFIRALKAQENAQ